jgi:hypothetical protein
MEYDPEFFFLANSPKWAMIPVKADFECQERLMGSE